MAFERVGQKWVRANDIKLGESISGHVVGRYNGGKYPEIDNIVMVLWKPITLVTRDGEKTYKKGDKVIINTAGNLKYFFKNGNKPGFLYQFTRTEDTVNKRNQPKANFLIEHDLDVEPMEVLPPQGPMAAAAEDDADEGYEESPRA